MAYDANVALTWRQVRRPGGSQSVRQQSWVDERNLPVVHNVYEDGLQVNQVMRYTQGGQRHYRRTTPLSGAAVQAGLGTGGAYRVERYVRDGAGSLVGVFDGEGQLLRWNVHGAGPIGRLAVVTGPTHDSARDVGVVLNRLAAGVGGGPPPVRYCYGANSSPSPSRTLACACSSIRPRRLINRALSTVRI
jgi:hypothetical protein